LGDAQSTTHRMERLALQSALDKVEALAVAAQAIRTSNASDVAGESGADMDAEAKTSSEALRLLATQ